MECDMNIYAQLTHLKLRIVAFWFPHAEPFMSSGEVGPLSQSLICWHMGKFRPKKLFKASMVLWVERRAFFTQ